MNTPPIVGFAGTRPAFEFSAQGQDSRWQEWHVIDRRNGLVICECWPPQPHNLDDAIDSLTIECEVCIVGLETVDVVRGEEVSEACQTCGRLGSDTWMTPLGKAELIAAELNALYPGEVGCGYCMTCGYGGERSPECLHKKEPTTEMLREAVVELRIQGATA
jgi:hypothetical protein